VIGWSSFRRSDLQDAIAHDLRGLLDQLHLLAHPCSGRLVPTHGLIDVRLNLSDQRLKILIFLHLMDPPQMD
jgi:hypothetical protein